MEAKFGQERENKISLLEKSCRQLDDENVLLKEEIQKLKMGWPTPTETMSARQCARRMQQNVQQQSEWRAGEWRALRKSGKTDTYKFVSDADGKAIISRIAHIPNFAAIVKDKVIVMQHTMLQLGLVKENNE